MMTIHFNIPLYFALITYYKHFRASKDMQLFHYHSTEGPLVEQQWSFDIWYASVRKIEEQLLVCNCIPKEEKLLIFKISKQDLGFNFKLNHVVFLKFFYWNSKLNSCYMLASQSNSITSTTPNQSSPLGHMSKSRRILRNKIMKASHGFDVGHDLCHWLLHGGSPSRPRKRNKGTFVFP